MCYRGSSLGWLPWSINKSIQCKCKKGHFIRLSLTLFTFHSAQVPVSKGYKTTHAHIHSRWEITWEFSRTCKFHVLESFLKYLLYLPSSLLEWWAGRWTWRRTDGLCDLHYLDLVEVELEMNLFLKKKNLFFFGKIQK